MRYNNIVNSENVRTEIFRKMTPAERIALAEQLWFEARHLKAASLRSIHPEWSEDQVMEKTREIFLRART